MDHKTLMALYRLLSHRFGPQHWWPARDPFEVILGAILTQATAWSNVEKALARLREHGWLSPAGLRACSQEALAQCIRPAGYFNSKARKLKAFVAFLDREYQGRLADLLAAPGPRLREQLLGVHGIGPETADSILLYGAGYPVFVVDAYTRRILDRLGLLPDGASYEEVRAWFESRLPRDAKLFNEFHALLVRLGKEHCRKQRPRCGTCPLRPVCAYGARYGDAGDVSPPSPGTMRGLGG